MQSSKGVALILVLWITTLLTIMASSFALTIQRETAIISGIKKTAEASAIADAGIHSAIVMLLSNDLDYRWYGYNSLYEIDFAGHRVRILITDESGKIDINRTNKEQLLEILISINVERPEADSLSDAIVDWRDKDDVPTYNGAEKQHYDDAGLKYEPRNDLFSSIEELQLVLGMRPEIYKRLENMISIHSNNVRINPASAPRNVLLTLPNVEVEMVEEYIQQRVDNQRNLEAVTHPGWYLGSNKKSNVFMIVAEAMIDDDISKQVMAVIRKRPVKNSLPFEVLNWTKDYHLPSLFQPGNDVKVIN